MSRTFPTIAIMIGLATGLLTLSGGDASARSEVWRHNGSEMVWTSIAGIRQVIKYRNPRNAVHRNGVQNGSVLFRGWRIGRRLYGRARTWRAGCHKTFRYKVRGWVSPDGRRAVLQGARPVIRDCRIVALVPYGRDATLVLEKRRPRDDDDYYGL